MYTIKTLCGKVIALCRSARSANTYTNNKKLIAEPLKTLAIAEEVKKADLKRGQGATKYWTRTNHTMTIDGRTYYV